MSVKRILLPTDFSKNSWNAISFAIQLFEKEQCIFYLLNTYTPVIYHVEYVLVNPAQFGIDDPIRENSERCLQTLSDRITNEYGNRLHSVECISAFSTLIPEIREIVEQKEIDVIVMGTKGATGAKEVLFGSNTVHVFKSVNCPVIAVPDKFSFEAPHEILIPSDLQQTYTGEQLRLLKDLAHSYQARIHLIHVMEDEQLTPVQESNKMRLIEELDSCSVLFHKLDNHSVPEAISNFQQRAKINLLVMISNKHSFFENLFFRPTINQIGVHLNIPLLVIPAS